MNWRYDSGLVAGAAPCYNADPNANTDCLGFSGTTDTSGNYIPNTLNGQPYIDLSGLSADQEFQAGLACNGVKATPYTGITTQGPTGPVSGCLASQLTSKLLSIAAINTENADKSPSRVAQRNLFDMSVGDDNVAHFGDGEHYKFSARVTAINVTNKYALYNFLSTFSGTHYVTPRTISAEIALHF
jgi:hypothetical protein